MPARRRTSRSAAGRVFGNAQDGPGEFSQGRANAFFEYAQDSKGARKELAHRQGRPDFFQDTTYERGMQSALREIAGDSTQRSGDALSSRARPWRALATIEGRQTEKVTYRGREITMARLPEASMWEAATRTPTPNGRSFVYVYVHEKTGWETLRAAKAKVDEIVDKLAQVRVGHRSGDARRRPDSHAAAAYRVFVKEMIARCGMGFHPDTPVSQYTDRDGKPGFTKAETKRLEAMEAKAYAATTPGGFDQYAIAMQEMRPLIRAAKKRTGW